MFLHFCISEMEGWQDGSVGSLTCRQARILQAGRRQLTPERCPGRHAHTDRVNKSVRRRGDVHWTLQGKASAGESHNPHKHVVRKEAHMRPLSPGQGSLSLQPGTLVTRAMLRSSAPGFSLPPPPPPAPAGPNEGYAGIPLCLCLCGPPGLTWIFPLLSLYLYLDDQRRMCDVGCWQVNLFFSSLFLQCIFSKLFHRVQKKVELCVPAPPPSSAETRWMRMAAGISRCIWLPDLVETWLHLWLVFED